MHKITQKLERLVRMMAMLWEQEAQENPLVTRLYGIWGARFLIFQTKKQVD